jgi:hypothetical protein
MKIKIKRKKLFIFSISFLFISVIVSLLAKQFFYIPVVFAIPIGIYMGYLLEWGAQTKVFWREMFFLFVIIVLCYYLTLYEIPTLSGLLKIIITLINNLFLLTMFFMFGLIIGSYIGYLKKRLS